MQPEFQDKDNESALTEAYDVLLVATSYLITEYSPMMTWLLVLELSARAFPRLRSVEETIICH